MLHLPASTRLRFSILAILLLSLIASSRPGEAASPSWVRSIGSSVMSAKTGPFETIADQTVRFPVRLTLGGRIFRLELSNAYGRSDVKIGAVTLSYMDGHKEVFIPVTVSDQRSFLISPGAPVVSDEIEAPLADFQVVTISIYLPESTSLQTYHRDRSPAVISKKGDFTGASSSEFPSLKSLDVRPLFSGLDVMVRDAKTIVAFGDSITDANDDVTKPIARWSDVLAQRLIGRNEPYAVANEAIFGNQILHDNSGAGALARFDRDVTSLPNVGYVVLLLGINDIGHIGDPGSQEVTAHTIIAGYQQMIERAHAHGIKVYASPLLPFMGAKYASENKDRVREDVNTWIETPGNFDAVIDFRKAVSDPDDPSRLNPRLERGDHLHPNDEGERRIGQSIDLSLFR